MPWASLQLPAWPSTVLDTKPMLSKLLLSDAEGPGRHPFSPSPHRWHSGTSTDIPEVSHLEEDRGAELLPLRPSTLLSSVSKTDTLIVLEFPAPLSHIPPVYIHPECIFLI